MFESVRKPNKELESIYCNSLLWWKQCWEFSQSNQSPSLFTVWFVWRGEENVCQQNTFSINSSITSENGNWKNSKTEDAQGRTSPLDYSDNYSHVCRQNEMNIWFVISGWSGISHYCHTARPNYHSAFQLTVFSLLTFFCITFHTSACRRASFEFCFLWNKLPDARKHHWCNDTSIQSTIQ